MRGAGETQPCVWSTLRTNCGSGLSVFLATYPRDGVPAKMANHRVGGQRVGWRFSVNAEFLPATSAFQRTDLKNQAAHCSLEVPLMQWSSPSLSIPGHPFVTTVTMPFLDFYY